jgi:uncharacterized protein (TIGR03435 family)
MFGAVAILSLSICAQIACAQIAGTEAPKFDVASVRVNPLREAAPTKIVDSTPGRFTVTNMPVRFLIAYAWDLRGDHELTGLPDWAFEDAFDVNATYPAERKPELRAMVQSLLAERFGLRTHRETREIPDYALVVSRRDGRLGPRLNPSDVDCAKWTGPRRDAGGPSPVSPTGKRPACMMLANRRFLTGGSQTLDEIAGTLQPMVGRPVVNKTGLSGSWDIDLEWTPLESTPNPDRDLPSIFAAVTEQLGLKLIPEKDPYQVLVIDNIGRPTAN